MAKMVPMKLVEIIPVFGLSVSLGFNNGLAFTAKLSQLLSKALNIYINWKLHCMYHPGRGREDEKNFKGDFKLNFLLKLVVTWLTSCRIPFSESQTVTSSPQME